MVKIVEPAIYELLKALAGGDVFAMRAPQNNEGPFIIYQRTDSLRWRAINNPSGIAQAFIQIDCYDPKYIDAKELGAQVETILDGFSGTVYHGTNSPQDEFIEIEGITLQNDVDLFDQTDEPLLFRNSMNYTITYKQ